MKPHRLMRRAAAMRSADFQSAVSQIYIPLGVRMPGPRNNSAPAECNSATQRITNLRRVTSRREAFTLIETLVYMSLLFVVLGLGYTAMYRSMDASAGLRRNARDITQALDAGERWREDVRTATQPLRVERISEDETLLHIPQANVEVTYHFTSHTVLRQVGSAGSSLALEHVNASTFISDSRQKVTAWKWELELQPYRKSLTRLHPLFTFLAVPANTAAQ